MKKIITLVASIIASVVIALPIIPPMAALAAAPATAKTVAPMKDTGVASGVTKMQALDIALKHAGYEMDDTLYTKVKKDYQPIKKTRHKEHSFNFFHYFC